MRVLRLAVRPEKEQFSNTLKLGLAGLLLLGFTGFGIQLLSEAFSSFVGGFFP